jgi:hypothetical protein
MTSNNGQLEPQNYKRKPHEKGLDRSLIAQMYFKGGLTHQQIADELNARESVDYTLTRRMIGYELVSIRKEWEEHQEDSDFWMTEAVQRTYWVEAAAWEGWAASLKPRERKTVKKGYHGDSDFEEIQDLYENQVGDKGFLKIVLDAIRERNRLRGIGAARLKITQDHTHTIKSYAIVNPMDWDHEGESTEIEALESG